MPCCNEPVFSEALRGCVLKAVTDPSGKGQTRDPTDQAWPGPLL